MTTPTFTEIKADKVSCAIGDVTMLPPTTFSVRPGENVAITGDNGCGKTTFLRVLTGNLIPTQGVVTRDGTPIDERDGATRRVIAPLIGPVAGFRDMTLADHLILIDQTWGGDRDGAGGRIADILGKFDILKFGNRFLSELSSGQRQLAELAMVLLRPSGLLVLDEPEQRLDPGRRHLLAEVLAERAKQGGAVVWVCHDQALAESSVTRVEHFPQGSRKPSTEGSASAAASEGGPKKPSGQAQGAKKKGGGGQPGRKNTSQGKGRKGTR